jgi:hypothetical protein
MIRYLLLLQLCIFTLLSFAQQGQLSISRIDRMPDSPTPLLIRDWKTVATDYDHFVFSTTKTGQYLPFLRLGTTGQFNYPDNTSLFLDSYVGAADHANQAEAINIIPAIVGASLVGIDKSNPNGTNWVAKTKDFFNLKNGQNVYLNSYSTTSGSDWWYDVMPNIYFYQLYSLYPNGTPEFATQFTTVADRWLSCVNKLGGTTTPWALPNMNYRAFNLGTGLPLNESVPEPESAGSIAWLLYNAYRETGNRKYMEGAQLSLEFLSAMETNPSYELQLPYGTLTAARMNAIEGTNYPIQKMLSWSFDRGALRGWGSIVGKWGGYDVSGLIGEANDAGDDYAFAMNGFQQAAALAPLPKYDKRFARAVAKWILNVANASRLFYWNALPQANQDSYNWASANDPTACIPHESMKQAAQGKSPFATGDAIGGGWAATNLSLYSGSSVGYLAAVVQTTNIPEILQIDLNKTDFYGDNSLVSYLYFNPAPTVQQVNVTLPPGTYGVYDAITETTLSATATGSIQLSIPAGEVRLVRLFPSGVVPAARDGKLYAGTQVLDYHYQYNYAETLRVKSISTDRNPIIVNSVFTAYCTPANVPSGAQVQFEWFLDGIPINGQTLSQVQVTAPATPSRPILKCRISANGQTAEDTLHLQVVTRVATPLVVKGIQSATRYTETGKTNTFTAQAESVSGETLEYAWSSSAGILGQTTGNPVAWQAPPTSTVATITVKVTNRDKLSTTVSVGALVKNTNLASQSPLIWYPFDTDSKNAVSDRFHATASGIAKTDDARGKPSLAYQFTSGQNIVYTANDVALNFADAVSLSCWIRCEQLGSERFIISHGSWQQRYKLSMTPEGKLRWTVKTSAGVADLDSSAPFELNRYYHVTATYTGYSMELYIDGILDTFKAFSGAIQPSTKPLTIGRMDDVETLYAFRGSIDEVRLWNAEIPVAQITQLKNEWANTTGVFSSELVARVYPNPADRVIHIELLQSSDIETIELVSASGMKVFERNIKTHESAAAIEIPKIPYGIYVLKIILKNGQLILKKIIIGQS